MRQEEKEKALEERKKQPNFIAVLLYKQHLKSLEKAKDKRTKTLNIRFSEVELDYIKLSAKEKSFDNLSDFIRTSSIQPIDLSKNINKKKCKLMTYEINKIGVNLHQITRQVNFSKTLDKEILQAIKFIQSQLDEVLTTFKKI
jgi:hypothetical protein